MFAITQTYCNHNTPSCGWFAPRLQNYKENAPRLDLGDESDTP